MYNAPISNVRIDSVYTKAQQELIEKIVKSLSSGDDGYRCISRNGKWDGSKALGGCGAMFFGEPTPGNKYAFVFAGHHLTIRCDGDFEDGTAFGGPVYYGHSPNGWSRGNVFNYQTQSVVSVYKALDEKQRSKATVERQPRRAVQVGPVPGEGRGPSPARPSPNCRRTRRNLVEKVMRDVLSPYRKEDVDEVMAIIKKRRHGEDQPRLLPRTRGMTRQGAVELLAAGGPGFVWNYRVLPHVHTLRQHLQQTGLSGSERTSRAARAATGRR